MSGLRTDLIFALRLLRKSPGFTAVAIGTLALGIGANTVIFTGIESFLLRPLPLKQPDRLVFAQQVRKKTGEPMATAYPDFVEWRREARAFESLGAMQIDTFNLTGEGESERIRGARATADFFAVTGLPPAAGRVFGAEEDRPGGAPVVVLSHGLAMRRFGGAAESLGRTLNVDGTPRTIVGVMPPAMRFPPGFSELWLPLATSEARHGWGDHSLFVIGRLRPGAGLAEARQQLESVARRLEETHPDSNKDMGVRAVPLHDQLARGPRPALMVLFAAVGFVLLICCANMANLLMARSAHRNREIAVRAALGASRGRLLRQLLAESVVLAVAGGFGGLLLATWGVEMLGAALPPILQPMGGLALDRRVFEFTAALSVSTGILFGILPAVRSLRAGSADNLREGARGGTLTFGRSRLASALVVGEVAAAVVLLVGAGLLVNALRRMQTADLGFEPRNVLTAEIAPKSARYREPVNQMLMMDELLRRLGTAPGVIAASAVNFPPMTSSSQRAYALEGERRINHEPPPTAGYRIATPGYLKAIGLRVVRGRFFTERDTWKAEPVIVVNDRFAKRAWRGQDPIGKRVALWTSPQETGVWRTVVGIVGDVRHDSPAAEPTPEFFFPYAQQPQESMYLAIRTQGDPGGFAKSLEASVRSVDPELPLSLVRPMERVIADATSSARFTTALLSIFSVLALLLSMMGLYGVISYLVARRTHEFGVRIALGATGSSLLRLVFGRSLLLTGVGALLGFAGGFAVARLLRALLFEAISPAPDVFIAIAALLAGVALAASWFPLRRALALDPARALRSE